MSKTFTVKVLMIILGGLCFTSRVTAQVNYDTTELQNQKDLIDVVTRIFNINKKRFDSTRLKKKVQFSFVPGAGTAPGGGRTIVTAFNAAFYTGSEQTTSLSSITFSPWFTFDGRFVIPIRSMVWLPNDFLLWRGDTRFMVYPQYTWGLGGKNDENEKILLDYNYLRINYSLLKKVYKKFFIGAGYNLDYHFNISAEIDSSHIPDIPVFGYQLHKKSVSTGPQLNFLMDSRKNSINPAGGFYIATDYRFNIKALGSTSNWQSLLLDVRKYFPFEKKRQNLLAVWGYYWGISNGQAPYLDLPSIGWDYNNKSGRGIRQNRYRSKQLIYGEAEYRKDISRNGFWGFVVFANLHTVSEFTTNRFEYLHPAAGAGLRIKFNKISKSNITIDFGMSKDYQAVYLGLGEIF